MGGKISTNKVTEIKGWKSMLTFLIFKQGYMSNFMEVQERIRRWGRIRSCGLEPSESKWAWITQGPDPIQSERNKCNDERTPLLPFLSNQLLNS